MALGYLSPYRRGSALAAGRGLNGGSIFDINREINRMFDALLEQGGDGSASSPGMLSPVLEVHHDEEKLVIVAELPGVKEEDVDLTIEDGTLTLRAEKRSERSDEERGYSERSYGTYMRRIALPPHVEEDGCSADFVDGVLNISLPLSDQKSRGRKIQLGRSKSVDSEAERALIRGKEETAPAKTSDKKVELAGKS